jgi:dienelactone hydrolase
MVTLFYLVAVAVFLAAHELLIRRNVDGTKAAGMRRLALVGTLAFAVAFGARAQLATRVQSAVSAWLPKPASFERTGDPFLRRALESQRPELPFPVSGSRQDVASWQTHAVEKLRNLSGHSAPIPATVSLRVVQTEDIGEVRRTLLEFTSWDGTSIPAYVHQPREATNLGGVLVIPGHGTGIRAVAGIGPADYQHGLGLELAKRGYVTLAPELRGFGMLAPNGMPVHTTVAHAALAMGSFYKAIVARDLSLALTVLQQWNGVDPTRLAVAGTSLGGELALFLGAVDPRPRVIISHSHGGSMGPELIAAARDDTGQAPHGCHTIPGINKVLHREDWFRLLAPRPLQVIRGAEDLGRRADVAAFEAATAQAFAQFGARDRFEFSVQPGGHEFFVEPAVQFLVKWL